MGQAISESFEAGRAAVRVDSDDVRIMMRHSDSNDSRDALIVCQTNEQVNPACSFHSPKYQPQKLRVRKISARSLADNDCFQRRNNE